MKRITPTRRGVYLLDIGVGLVLISAAMLLFTSTFFQLAGHRSDRKIRQVALDTLENVNVLLDLDTLPITEPVALRERIEPLEKMTARALPDGKLTLTVLPKAENVVLIRIVVSYDDGRDRPRREFSILRALPAPPVNVSLSEGGPLS